MTHQDIEDLSKQNHYVRQLVCLKQCFGLHAKIGCVTGEGCETTNCGTIAELHAIGWCGPEFLVIDQHWDKLELIRPNKERTPNKGM